jgi:hypothetical protein
MSQLFGEEGYNRAQALRAEIDKLCRAHVDSLDEDDAESVALAALSGSLARAIILIVEKERPVDTDLIFQYVLAGPWKDAIRTQIELLAEERKQT